MKRTCNDCGFENAEPGKACQLCGASDARYTALPDQDPTLRFPETGRLDAASPESAAAGSAVGRVFAQRYEVEALVGSGGMGQVYRVRDLRESSLRAGSRSGTLFPYLERSPMIASCAAGGSAAGIGDGRCLGHP